MSEKRELGTGVVPKSEVGGTAGSALIGVRVVRREVGIDEGRIKQTISSVCMSSVLSCRPVCSLALTQVAERDSTNTQPGRARASPCLTHRHNVEAMPASTHTKDENQFWKLVWPTLKTGGWSYEEEGAEGKSGGGSDQSDEGRSTAAPAPAPAGGNSRRTSSRNRKRSTSSSASNASSRSSNSSPSSSPAAASSPRESPAAGAGGAAAGTSPPKKPVFVPPVVGVASEALEEAMRRSAPADGSLEEERPSRLVGVDAVIELLQQVPGFPGTTTGIVNFDAVAAAARGVMVRTQSPPPVAENGAAAGTPTGEVSTNVCSNGPSYTRHLLSSYHTYSCETVGSVVFVCVSVTLRIRSFTFEECLRSLKCGMTTFNVRALLESQEFGLLYTLAVHVC